MCERKWCIWFYDIWNVKHEVKIKAESFDEALAKARKIDPRFNTGCVA
jgi:hypothetical protein